LSFTVSWLRIQSLHSFFSVICQPESTQDVVGEGSHLSLVGDSEGAQKMVGEGSSEGRSVSVRGGVIEKFSVRRSANPSVQRIDERSALR
jgi:hypothetical protein